ncbi:MAG: ABC transporter substrate-binding protein [Geminicoccaceae bacterium]
MLPVRAVILAAAIILTPLGASAADLVVWWEKGFYPQADEAVRDIVAAFEQQTGKHVELVQPAQDEIMRQAARALQAGAPPDFLFSSVIATSAARWAYDGRLVDLEGALGPVLDLFDADTIEVSTLLDGKTGRRGLYALPVGRISNHVHVWNSLLERAGFTLADIPQEWGAFWSFWCDRVQPALRRAIGRENIWAVGLPMSVAATVDTEFELTQFQLAHQASWLSRDRRVQVDDPAVRAGMVRAMDAYTEIWRKGCTPPDSVSWTNIDNNKAFLAQTVVLTPNPTLSIPAALRTARPDDYYQNAATIDWPLAANGEPLVLEGRVDRAVVFKDSGHGATAEEFVRFLAEWGLAHWVTSMGDQYMLPMRKLVEQPFWLDPSDPHRMRAAIQIMTQPQLLDMDVRADEWRSGPIWDENVWGKAVHRVVTEGISPEQAVDEAIARIKEILAE